MSLKIKQINYAIFLEITLNLTKYWSMLAIRREQISTVPSKY
jgi:hypothetical protein